MKKEKAVSQNFNEDEAKLVKNKVIRIIVFVVGFIAFILGTIGIVLPILPTVPFYLLAAFCFVRSSIKFNKWFLNSKLYKKHVENFAKNHAMIITNEILLLVSVSALLMTTMYFINKPVMTIVFTLLIACKYSYFIFGVKPISKDEFVIMKTKMDEENKKEMEVEAC